METKMTEASIISTRIDLLKERKDLITREIDFKIAMLEAKLKKIASNYSFVEPINCCNATHTRGMTGSEIVQKTQRQNPRATNFDYKNEVEAGGIAPETV